MAGTPEIIVKFLADTSKLSEGFKNAEGSAKSFGDTTKKMGKAAVLAGGAAGLGVLVSALHTGIDEFSEASKVSAQTEAAIKSTGGAANVSADQISSMAEALMKKSGVDDEAIQSGENLLLTFTKVQNVAGKGNDIFNQATKTMLDMSVALGQDTTQSAMQLGKALNDPIKGMTALRRVGVSFTAAQVEQVKAMQAAGDTMGAQKLILAELNKEFGGSAEAAGKTLPGQLSVLKESYSNLMGELVGAVAPALSQVATLLAEHPALFKALIVTVLALSAAFVVMAGALLVVQVVASPLILIILAVIAVVAALAAAAYLIYTNWGAIADFFTGIWETIKAGLQSALDWVRSNWPLIVGIMLGPLALIVALVVTHWAQIKAAIQAALTAIQSAITTAWNAIKAAMSAVLTALEAAVNVAWNAIKAAIAAASSAIQASVQLVVTAFNTAKAAATALASFLEGVFVAGVNAAKAALAALEGLLVGAFTGALNTAKGAASTLAGILSGALNTAASIAKSALGGLQGIVSAIAGAFDSAAGAVDRLVEAIKRIPSHINLPSIPHVNIPGLAGGGIVTRPTLALIGEHGPEAVVPLSQMSSVAAGGASNQPFEVRVFIGDQELRGLVRAEVIDQNTGLARTLLAGAR